MSRHQCEKATDDAFGQRSIPTDHSLQAKGEDGRLHLTLADLCVQAKGDVGMQHLPYFGHSVQAKGNADRQHLTLDDPDV